MEKVIQHNKHAFMRQNCHIDMSDMCLASMKWYLFQYQAYTVIPGHKRVWQNKKYERIWRGKQFGWDLRNHITGTHVGVVIIQSKNAVIIIWHFYLLGLGLVMLLI